MSNTLAEPLSDAALRAQAESQVDAEIRAQSDPLQAQINSAERRQESALQQVGSIFGELQPVVQQGAENVATSYANAQQSQRQIFDAAQANLNQLMQQRAATAQQMAQTLGAPVAVDDFTRPFSNAVIDLTQLGAGQQLHTLAYAQAGEQQAQQFANQVFPVMRTEQDAQVRRQYSEEIKGYQDELAAIKAQKGSLVNARYSEIRQAELQYRIQVAQVKQAKLDSQRDYNLQVRTAKQQQADADRTYRLSIQQLKADTADKLRNYKLAVKSSKLDQTKANRDWTLALKADKREEKKLKLAEKDFDLRAGELKGVYDGMPTLAAKTASKADAREAQSLGISKAELQLKKRELVENAKLAKAKIKADQKTQLYDLIDQALNPKPGGTITQTYKVDAPKPNFGQDVPDDVFVDKSSATGYSKMVTVKTPSKVTEPINDPTKLIDYLTATGDYTRAEATRAVKARFQPFGLPDDWKYGQKWPPKKSTTTKPNPATTRNPYAVSEPVTNLGVTKNTTTGQVAGPK